MIRYKVEIYGDPQSVSLPRMANVLFDWEAEAQVFLSGIYQLARGEIGKIADLGTSELNEFTFDVWSADPDGPWYSGVVLVGEEYPNETV